eukprot:Gb_33231 [translate_table: standard]
MNCFCLYTDWIGLWLLGFGFAIFAYVCSFIFSFKIISPFGPALSFNRAPEKESFLEKEVKHTDCSVVEYWAEEHAIGSEKCDGISPAKSTEDECYQEPAIDSKKCDRISPAKSTEDECCQEPAIDSEKCIGISPAKSTEDECCQEPTIGSEKCDGISPAKSTEDECCQEPTEIQTSSIKCDELFSNIECNSDLDSIAEDDGKSRSEGPFDYSGTGQNAEYSCEPTIVDNEELPAKEEENKAYDEDTNAGNEDISVPNGYEEDYETEDHEFFIQKLKSEIRRLKAPNLSSIPEECESDLMDSSVCEKESETSVSARKIENYSCSVKPIQHNIDLFDDFYEKYTQRMRCFDMLNYQQMYTIGFFQSNHETPMPKPYGMTSRLRKCILNKAEVTDDTRALMRRLEHEFETVYVAQTCLSWEALHWQYKKFQEVALSDCEAITLYYDHVADQFQQFQVLLQRFMENEQFEGPRIQSYVRNRCILRNILQVPSVKGSMKAVDQVATGTDTVTAAELVRIMEGTITTFWDFIRSDKEKSSMNQLAHSFLWKDQQLEDPTDSALLKNTRQNLNLKEVKVRDLQRRGRCLLKRLHPSTGEGFEILMALVDIKVVSRVLKMSRITTDHLQWCQKKLNKLSVSEGKVHRECCTVLFPTSESIHYGSGSGADYTF